MKNHLSDVLYSDFIKLVEVITRLSNSKDPVILTIQLEYFITGLEPLERYALNQLVEEYLETGTIAEISFATFKNSCRANEIIIDENGKTVPQQSNYTTLRIMTIKATSEIAQRQKCKTSVSHQLADVWYLHCFDGIKLTVNHHIQEELLFNKYRNELVNKETFTKYAEKVKNLFGSYKPWYYVVNYCKSKRTFANFNTFLKTFYEIVDCIEEDRNVAECHEYAERIKLYC